MLDLPLKAYRAKTFLYWGTSQSLPKTCFSLSGKRERSSEFGLRYCLWSTQQGAGLSEFGRFHHRNATLVTCPLYLHLNDLVYE